MRMWTGAYGAKQARNFLATSPPLSYLSARGPLMGQKQVVFCPPPCRLRMQYRGQSWTAAHLMHQDSCVGIWIEEQETRRDSTSFERKPKGVVVLMS